MAWTAPITWVDGTVINASGTGSLNEQIRDNMLALSTHAHSGAAGDGSSTLTGVSFSSITSMGFADQSANPSSTGVMQRNGTAVLYYNGSSAIDLTTADASAGTASLRTLGSGATTASAGNHQHTFATVSATTSSFTNLTSANLTNLGADASTPPTNAELMNIETNLHNATYTASSNASSVAIVVGGFYGRNQFGGVSTATVTMTVKLYYDGTLKQTITGLSTALGNYGIGNSDALRTNVIGSTSGKVIRVTGQITSTTNWEYPSGNDIASVVGWDTNLGTIRSTITIAESTFTLGVA